MLLLIHTSGDISLRFAGSDLGLKQQFTYQGSCNLQLGSIVGSFGRLW